MRNKKNIKFFSRALFLLLYFSLLSAAPDKSNFIISQTFNTYRNMYLDENVVSELDTTIYDVQKRNLFSEETRPGFRIEYNHPIWNNLKALGALSFADASGSHVFLEYSLGLKNYFTDYFYMGFTYSNVTDSREKMGTLPQINSNSIDDNWDYIFYESKLREFPELGMAFFAGLELFEDWNFELRYRQVAYVVEYFREEKLIAEEKATADEFTFSVGIIY